MNKKTIFDKCLYREGMRSLKVFGSLFTALLAVFAILYSVGMKISSANTITNAYECFTNLRNMYSFLYFGIIVLVVPILTLKTFSFLTTRNGSDFYHAIPHTKQCVYLSFVAATITWTGICILVPMILSYALFMILGLHGMTLYFFVSAFLHILVAALLVTSAISIGCAITGTILTNIIMAGLVLFFPRVFLYACRLIVHSLTNGFLPNNSFFFGTRCNLVVQSIIGLPNNDYYLFAIAPLVYTFLLCIVYFAIAAFLFGKRPSELAMKPNLSNRFQAISCLLLGTSFSLIPVALILGLSEETSIKEMLFGEDQAALFILVTIYIIIIIGMGVYELLTTKKARNLLKLIPRTGILAVINIVLIFGLLGCKKLVLLQTPSASDIKSVSFNFAPRLNSELFDYGYYNWDASPVQFTSKNTSSNGYFLLKENQYKTNNEEIKQIIAQGFELAVGNRTHTAEEYSDVEVTVNTGIRNITRSIKISAKDHQKLKKIIEDAPAYQEIYRKLPKLNKNQVSVGRPGLSQDQVYDLYETARKEIAAFNDEQWRTYYSDATYGAITFLQFAVNMGSCYATDYLPLTGALPKTTEKYFKYVQQQNGHLLNVFESEYPALSKETYAYVDITPYSNLLLSNEQYYISETDFDAKEVKDFLHALTALASKEIDISKKDAVILEVQGYAEEHKGSHPKQGLTYVQIDKKVMDPFVQYYEKKYNSYSDETEILY